MPTRVDEYWKERVKSLKANNLAWGAGRITGALELLAINNGRNDCPSPRWVGDVLKKEWDGMSSSEQAQYRQFYWPTSLERGDLPWEASAACLKLLALRVERPDWRPSIRLARLYWQVHQSAPDLPARSTDNELPGGVDVAGILEHIEAQGLMPEEQLRAAIEAYLVYAPWRSETDLGLYHSALRTLGIRPITIGFPRPDDIMVGPGFW